MADSTLKPAESNTDATVNNDNLNSDATTAPATASEGATAPNAADESTEGNDTNAPTQKGRKKRILGVDPSLIISDGRSKRRKTPSPEPVPKPPVVKDEPEKDVKDKVRAASLGREIYKKVMDSTNPKDGESMAGPFIKLPPKKQFPDYYVQIKNPMCLDMVRQKLDHEEYDSLKDVIADLSQIWINAKRYNTKDSDLFQWAKKLHKLTRTFFAQVTDADANPHDSDDEPGATTGPSSGPSKPRRSSSSVVKGEHVPAGSVDPEDEDVDMGGPSNVSMDGESQGPGGRAGKKRGAYMKDGPTVYKLVRPVMTAIMNARSKDGMDRDITGIFMHLPDRKELPDYYNMIKEPISLSEIEDRVKGRRYDSWEEFFEQAYLMCSNAMLYNEDESDVFRDAQQIKSILDEYQADIKHRLSLPSIAAQKKSKIPPPPVNPSRQTLPNTPSQLGHNGISQHHSVNGHPSGSTAPNHVYKPPLPAGICNEEIVARLPQYSSHDQQNWINTLTQAGLGQYRSIVATLEARRRTLAGLPPPPLSVPPSSGRVGANASTANGAPITLPFNLAYRTKPPQPLIKHLDFAFNAPISVGEGTGKERHAIRLHNLRGVVTHSLIIGGETSEVEITAYLSDDIPPESSGTPNGSGVSPTPPAASTPEVRLRVNGNPGSMGRYIYAEGELGAESAALEGPDGPRGKPVGMRWVVPVAQTKMETRVDVVCVAGGRTEICGVYVNRQF